MGLLGFITRPIRRRIHGIQGEKKVHKKLNPMFFGKVEHEELKNVTLVDEYGNSHQIDFVEIRSNGVFCIEVKNFKGVVYGSENDENWTIMLGRKKYKQLNPLKQNKSHCYQISRLFNGKYQINSLIVLANNNAGNIKASNVVNLDDLRKYLALYKDGHTLRPEDMKYIYLRLRNQDQHLSTSEHVRNVKKRKKEIKNNICPICKKPLVLREGKTGKFYGCSGYPRCKFTKKI